MGTSRWRRKAATTHPDKEYNRTAVVVCPRGKTAGVFRAGSGNGVSPLDRAAGDRPRGPAGRATRVFLQTSSDERHPAFSPDGRWLAYSSTESGGFQVYVRAFPDTGGKWQISSAGGFYPMWSRSGRKLFFESLDNRIMVADYTVQDDSFVPDKPRVWSETRLANLGLFKNFDLAPDGKRVVALLPPEGGETQQSQHHVVFLENFFDELRRRAPVKR